MADQCKHCEYRGDMQKCEAADCGHHYNWYVNELRSKLAKAERSLTLGGYVDNGAELWKPPVNKKANELHAQLARCVDALEAIAGYDIQSKPQYWNVLHRDIADETLKILPQQAKLDAEVLRCALPAIDAVFELMRVSRGVDGLHLNGDIALWTDLLRGGRFEEWLEPLELLGDAVRAAKDGE